MKFVKNDTGEKFNGVYAYCVEIREEDWTSRFIVTGVRSEDGAVRKVKAKLKKEEIELEDHAGFFAWRFILPNHGVAQIN